MKTPDQTDYSLLVCGVSWQLMATGSVRYRSKSCKFFQQKSSFDARPATMVLLAVGACGACVVDCVQNRTRKFDASGKVALWHSFLAE